eukprot:CAMPEP_0167774968 /NCGR_PEP_ID=MMETSP0111_2-20121227/2293_1 /TAXON_ID=91324 /ORGANISM="Lotharella globosa, Strain CCCM811" /LENGTH=86 /DNA_ID=CAMNT_0007664821 /DNA_START=1050 /DNA_END=1310 /DNA_ORIENTATION=-
MAKPPTTYRQPMLSLNWQSSPPPLCSSGQLLFGITSHAINATVNPPSDQNTDNSTISRPLSSLGVNSANIAPSTGRFPPTPVPMTK